MVSTEERDGPNFSPPSNFFPNEAYFSREGSYNAYNSHACAVEKPSDTRTCAAKLWFAVSIWSGIMEDHLIGLYLLPLRLDGRCYERVWKKSCPKC
ncbi:hypothetical protein AVEN_109250-1 [Araneus ventricosus]|uniref:Uncharacterized protein n=1 Tax=Araneus ventricosus TaxID=182803 RepID=A0A4Y2DNA1_ARAVE|nr:hypothetical protein AVEN_125826-1 [Araneus ventricosus]GBN46211.1 hypothetical protein AVEN_109250-1 [Araneus ventricosus]